MKIGFFEVEHWAQEKIKKAFKDCLITTDKLEPDNASRYGDLELISTFVYSDLSSKNLTNLPNLKFIATRSTGFDHIDLGYCKKNNIIASNVPTYGERTVAEHTFGLLLTLTRKIYTSISRTKQEGLFHLVNLRGIDLFGKTIGIVGLGSIGLEVLKIAKAFGMKVLVCTKTEKLELVKKYGFEYVDINTLLKKSNVITLHLPLNKETTHMINKDNITEMREGAYLINTARGGLIETEALLLGLKKGILAGVGLDVLEDEHVLKEEAELLSSEFRKKIDYENLVLDHILIKHPKVIVTPHNAFNSIEALERILKTSIDNINAFIEGHPQNVVS